MAFVTRGRGPWRLSIMTTCLCVIANLDEGGLGRPNRLMADLCGKPVLARTLDRLKGAEGFERRAVVVSKEDAAARALLAAYPEYEVFVSLGEMPTRRWLRNSRKWAPHSWRGGINDTFASDEEDNPVDLLKVAQACRAEWVAVLC